MSQVVIGGGEECRRGVTVADTGNAGGKTLKYVLSCQKHGTRAVKWKLIGTIASVGGMIRALLVDRSINHLSAVWFRSVRGGESNNQQSRPAGIVRARHSCKHDVTPTKATENIKTRFGGKHLELRV